MTSMTGLNGMQNSSIKPGPRGAIGGDIIQKGYRAGQLQQFSPEQMQLFQSLFSHASPDSFLSKLANGDQGAFEQMEAPAHRQFQGQLGQLASRFSGMGTGGRKSSGFQNSATASTSNFAQDLQSRRHDLQRQALMDLGNFSNMLLNNKPFERTINPRSKKTTFWDEIGTEFGTSLAGSLGNTLGGGIFNGGGGGGGRSSGLSSMFGGGI